MAWCRQTSVDLDLCRHMALLGHVEINKRLHQRPLSNILPMLNNFINTAYVNKSDTCQSWWRHQMETFSTLLAICAGNSPVPGDFPTQRPVTRSFDVFFDLSLNKQLSN